MFSCHENEKNVQYMNFEGNKVRRERKGIFLFGLSVFPVVFQHLRDNPDATFDSESPYTD